MVTPWYNKICLWVRALIVALVKHEYACIGCSFWKSCKRCEKVTNDGE